MKLGAEGGAYPLSHRRPYERASIRNCHKGRRGKDSFGEPQPATVVEMGVVEKRCRILVVDDSPIVLGALRERLSNAGYEVATHDSATGSVIRAADIRPHIVLLDVMMPLISGSRIAQMLGANCITRTIGVVLHSGKPASELSRLAAEVGALGAIPKGIPKQEFLAQLQRYVRLHMDTVPEAGTLSGSHEAGSRRAHARDVLHRRLVAESQG